MKNKEFKCPDCVKEGKKSRVDFILCRVIPSFFSTEKFYDEDGVYHSHYSQDIGPILMCKRGHEFHEIEIAGCPSCDFAKEEKDRQEKRKLDIKKGSDKELQAEK